jgi:hypothetical protein
MLWRRGVMVSVSAHSAEEHGFESLPGTRRWEVLFMSKLFINMHCYYEFEGKYMHMTKIFSLLQVVIGLIVSQLCHYDACMSFQFCRCDFLGGQIGRIFVLWVIFNFGNFFEIHK